MLIQSLDGLPFGTGVDRSGPRHNVQACSLYIWPNDRANDNFVVSTLWPQIVSSPFHIVILAIRNLARLETLVGRYAAVFQDVPPDMQLIFACQPPRKRTFAQLAGDIPTQQQSEVTSGERTQHMSQKRKTVAFADPLPIKSRVSRGAADNRDASRRHIKRPPMWRHREHADVNFELWYEKNQWSFFEINISTMQPTGV